MKDSNWNKHANERSYRSEQRANILITNKDFVSDVQAIRNKWDFPKTDTSPDAEVEMLKLCEIFEKDEERQRNIRKDIGILAKKYKLGPSWIEGIYSYALHNDPFFLSRPIILDIEVKENEDTGLEELWVRIDPDTSIEDIKFAWERISRIQKHLNYAGNKKFQPVDVNVAKRDAYAYELKQKGLQLREIAEQVTAKFPRSNGEDYWWSDVSKMIERHKKR